MRGSRGGLWVAALAAALSGCATAGTTVFDHGRQKTVVYDFGYYKVIKAPKRMVQEACYHPGSRFDDGSRQVKSRINACWKAETKEMWVREDRPFDIIHELCHMEGYREDKCLEFQWEAGTVPLQVPVKVVRQPLPVRPAPSAASMAPED